MKHEKIVVWLERSLLAMIIILVLLALVNTCNGQTITVYPDNYEPLNKRLFRAGAVDIGYTGRFVARSATSPEYVSWVREIGFTGLDFPGESTADYSHFLPSPGDGYNCQPPCHDQDGGKRFGKDFFYEWLALCDSLNVNRGYVANVQTGNIDEVLNVISYGVDVIRWGGEQQLIENEDYWPDGGSSYKSKIDEWIRSTQGTFSIIDAAPSWRNSSRINREWNDDLQGISGDAGRFYIWADEFTDQATVSSISDFWDYGITEYEEGFFSTFPGHTIAVTQFGWKQNAPNINTGLNAIFLAKGYRHFINNQDKYSYSSFQSLKSLESFENNYTALTLIGDLFANGYKFHVSEIITGIDVVTTGSTGENGTFTTLIINSTGEQKELSIKIDGRKKFCEGMGVHFATPSSSVAVEYGIESTKNFTVEPYSITIIFH